MGQLYRVYIPLVMKKAPQQRLACVSVALNRHRLKKNAHTSSQNTDRSEIMKTPFEDRNQVDLESSSAGLLQLVGELKSVIDRKGISTRRETKLKSKHSRTGGGN